MKLNLGCGPRPRDGYINTDFCDMVGVDAVFDATGNFPFDDETFDEVYSSQFLQAIPNDKKIHVINEIWRVLRPGGFMEHVVPEAGTPVSFGWVECNSFWNEMTFKYFEKDDFHHEFYKKYPQNPIKAVFERVYLKRENGDLHIRHKKVCTQ